MNKKILDSETQHMETLYNQSYLGPTKYAKSRRAEPTVKEVQLNLIAKEKAIKVTEAAKATMLRQVRKNIRARLF